MAREIVSRTRIFKRLCGNHERPVIDFESIHTCLIQISQLIIDVAEIVELDINPLMADEHGVLALDASILVHPTEAPGSARLAIKPYPKEVEEIVTLNNGKHILIRPIRPEDEPAHYSLFSKLTPEDIHFRFFGSIRFLPHREMARYTQIDYDREMAFIATRKRRGGEETLGVVRAVNAPDTLFAEFAIIVRSDVKGQGLGRMLLEKIIQYCQGRGVPELRGQVRHDNHAMQELAKTLDFLLKNSPEGLVDVSLKLDAETL